MGLQRFHFIFFILRGTGISKTLCFHRLSGSWGALGAPKPCVFKGFRAPHGPWEPQNPMFSQVFGLLGGASGLHNLMFSQMFSLLGGPGSSKTLCFHRFSGSSGALGAQKFQNPMFSQVFWLLGGRGGSTVFTCFFLTCLGSSQTLCFTGVLAPKNSVFS